LDVSFQELDKSWAFVSAYVGFPLPIHRRNWKCLACGHQWENTDELQEP
jgi:hypothetical protein